jgi:hypothetical protein
MGNWFGWGNDGDTRTIEEIPNIFPLDFSRDAFVEIDVMAIFQKILTDVLERTHGLTPEQINLLSDNCIQSEAAHGLISILARGMAFRRILFLVYDQAINLLRLATPEEQGQITSDYAKTGSSKVGVYISFQHYLKADLVRLYAALEYITVASLHKSMNLSVAIQLKMNDLRTSTSLTDSADVKVQAQKIAQNLKDGKDVLMDAKDVIENAVPDLTAIDAALSYLSHKKSFYLGMPRSYITGEQTGGIGSTGEGDTKAVERGLKNYYESIIRPVCKTLFQVETSYKSQDFRQIDQGLNALKTFALVDESLMNIENKTLIINKLFDLPEDEKGEVGVIPDDQRLLNNSYPQI